MDHLPLPGRFGASLRERLAAATPDADPPEVDERVAAAAHYLIREVEVLARAFHFYVPASVERLRKLLPPDLS